MGWEQRLLFTVSRSRNKGGIMGLFYRRLDRARRRPYPAPSVRPLLEPLEDRCLPAANALTAMNTVASLSHDQIHVLQDQSQQQTTTAILRLEVEQIALSILQPFASQIAQFKPLIAGLMNAIPRQQATVQTLQNQTNLLNQLDDLQDQSLLLNAQIQTGIALVPMLRQQGDTQAVNVVNSILFADQAAVQSLQPRIETVEGEVSAFV
jgi:hypothetical protein